MRSRVKVFEFAEKYFCLTTIAAVIAIVLASCSVDTNGYYSKGIPGSVTCIKKTERIEECKSQK